MTGWMPIHHLSRDMRCLVSDGEQYYMGGYMRGDDDGFWYADDNAPILSEDITLYMAISPPVEKMTGTIEPIELAAMSRHDLIKLIRKQEQQVNELKDKLEKDVKWALVRMKEARNDAIRLEERALKAEQQVNTLQYQLAVQTKAAEIGARNLVVAEQQVNTLTEALKWYEKQDVICTPRYCDGGQRAREALQSIKESPREEQGK